MGTFKHNSLCSKGTAVGFVVLILSANLWVAFLLANQEAPDFIVIGFFIGLLIATVFGICLTVSIILDRLNLKNKDD